MRGHTSNGSLAAALGSLHRRARWERDRRTEPDELADREYFRGRMDSARELAVLLYVEPEYDAVLLRIAEAERAKEAAAAAPSAPPLPPGT